MILWTAKGNVAHSPSFILTDCDLENYSIHGREMNTGILVSVQSTSGYAVKILVHERILLYELKSMI